MVDTWNHVERKIDCYRGMVSKYSKEKLFKFRTDPNSDNVTSYLPGVEVNRDHEGGSSRARPFHCTSAWLTPTITPNVGNSNA